MDEFSVSEARSARASLSIATRRLDAADFQTFACSEADQAAADAAYAIARHNHGLALLMVAIVDLSTDVLNEEEVA